MLVALHSTVLLRDTGFERVSGLDGHQTCPSTVGQATQNLVMVGEDMCFYKGTVNREA
jgi:hypothetical protein